MTVWISDEFEILCFMVHQTEWSTLSTVPFRIEHSAVSCTTTTTKCLRLLVDRKTSWLVGGPCRHSPSQRLQRCPVKVQGYYMTICQGWYNRHAIHVVVYLFMHKSIFVYVTKLFDSLNLLSTADCRFTLCHC